MKMVDKNFKIVRGDNFSFTLEFKNSDGEIMDVTNYKLMFTVKKSANDTDENAVISKTITIADGTAGKATIDLEPSDTTINAGVYSYDIQVVTNDGGSVYTLILGTITIITDITQRVG